MATPTDPQRNELPAILILGAVHGIGGMIVGGLLGALLIGPWLVGSLRDWLPAFVVENPRFAFGVLGGFLGACSGFGKVLSQLRSHAQRRATAERLGMQTGDRPAAATEAFEDDLRTMFAADTMPVVTPIAHDETPLGTLTIADVKWSEGGTSGTDHVPHRETFAETVAHISVCDQRLPRFALQRTGRIGKWLSNLTGHDHGAALGDPELMRRYHFQADHPEIAAELFSEDVRALLRADPDWDLRSTPRCLVLSRARRTAGADDLAKFRHSALALAGPLLAVARHAPAEPEPAPVRLGDDPALDALLEAAPPRRIPSALRRRLAPTEWLPLVVGSGFLVGGTLAAVLGNSVATSADDRALSMTLGTILICVGALVVGLAVWLPRRKLRLVRRGQVATGRIVEAKPTSTFINNQRIHRITIRYSLNGQDQVGTCKLTGTPAEAAARCAETDRDVRLLYDASKPQRVMWDGSLRGA